MSHKTVLLKEAVDGLSIDASDTVVDATFGGGGHAQEILRRLKKGGTLVAIDIDTSALDASKLPPSDASVHLVQDNFAALEDILGSLHIEKVDAIIADLGWRMEQFESGGKGLSFQRDEPLQMTFGNPDEYPFTAYDIVNDWDETTLSNIFFGYAEVRYARRIAKKIVEHRKHAPIATTNDLVAVVKEAVPRGYLLKRTHPATKVFQALRIAVNDELTVLDTFLHQALKCLEVGGRLAVITFHSIEDRIVKQTFRSFKANGQAALVTKKPLVPSIEETSANPRARSAKLRIIEKIITS